MLNEASEIYKPNISQVYLNVNDIEKIYNLAIKNGATSLMKLMLRPHGMEIERLVLEVCTLTYGG